MDPLRRQIEKLNQLMADPMVLYESKLWGHYTTLEDETDRDAFVLAMTGKVMELQARLKRQIGFF